MLYTTLLVTVFNLSYTLNFTIKNFSVSKFFFAYHLSRALRMTEAI